MTLPVFGDTLRPAPVGDGPTTGFFRNVRSLLALPRDSDAANRRSSSAELLRRQSSRPWLAHRCGCRDADVPRFQQECVVLTSPEPRSDGQIRSSFNSASRNLTDTTSLQVAVTTCGRSSLACANPPPRPSRRPNQPLPLPASGASAPLAGTKLSKRLPLIRSASRSYRASCSRRRMKGHRLMAGSRRRSWRGLRLEEMVRAELEGVEVGLPVSLAGRSLEAQRARRLGGEEFRSLALFPRSTYCCPRSAHIVKNDTSRSNTNKLQETKSGLEKLHFGKRSALHQLAPKCTTPALRAHSQ